MRATIPATPGHESLNQLHPRHAHPRITRILSAVILRSRPLGQRSTACGIVHSVQSPGCAKKVPSRRKPVAAASCSSCSGPRSFSLQSSQNLLPGP